MSITFSTLQNLGGGSTVANSGALYIRVKDCPENNLEGYFLDTSTGKLVLFSHVLQDSTVIITSK